MNHIYFAGYDVWHPDDFIFNVAEGYEDCYLLLITHTPAQFWVDGQIEEAPAHSAILYPPHHKIWYGACGECYGNDWIRFASDEPAAENFPLAAHPFPVSDPDYCHNLFQLLVWEAGQSGEKEENEQSSQIISPLLHILFLKLRSDVLHRAASPHDHELLGLRREIANSPQLSWTVAEMAKQLHMSMGHLQLLYKQKFEISCIDDVISFRIQKAKDLLAFSDASMAEIAEQCGYHNTEHFCRQFRKVTGLSPGRFRQQGR